MSSKGLGVAKDLGKRGRDMLTKDFPQDYVLEWKGKGAQTPHGQLETEIKLTQKADKVNGLFKNTLKGIARNTDVEFSLETDRTVKAEFALSDELVQNLKTKVAAESSKGDNFATFSLEYKHAKATATLSADYGKADGSSLKASLLAGQPQGLVVAAEVDYVAGAQSGLSSYSVTAGYRSAELDLLAFDRRTFQKSKGESPKDEKDEFGVSLYHQTSPDFTVVAEVSLDVQSTSTAPKLVLGSQWKATADTAVKSTFDTSGKIAFAYQQKLGPRVTGTIGATSNVSNMAKGNTTFGISLALTD